MNLFFSLFLVIGVNGQDYFDQGGRTLGTSGGPTLVRDQLKGFEPIYVAPDLEDILDQQQFNVYHEEVHGSILMPRLSFALNDDDQPIRNEDYGDYLNLLPGVDPKFYGRKKKKISKGCGPGCAGGQGVPIFGNPMHNPTIEEMIPWTRRRDTKDTFIVMADDPIVAVDSVPKCSKNANKGESGSTEGASTEAGASSESGASTEGTTGGTGETTAAGDSTTETTTVA